MINIGALLMLFISLSSSSCHKEEHRYIYLKNNSSKSIYYGISYSYPDTSLQKIEDVPGRNGNISHEIISGDQETLLAADFAVNSTMQLFIFNADVIEKNTWDSIVTHHMVLKRYQYTESDMGKANWTITYP
jgi:hypothetical protein